MKKIISITIAILFVIPQQALCLRPKAAKLAGTVPNAANTTELTPTFTVPLTPARKEALQYLETGEASDETINRLINSDDIAVFLSYLYSIPKYKRKIPENMLDTIFRFKETKFRSAITKAIAAIKNKDAVNILKQWVKKGEESEDVRAAIADALGNIGDKESVNIFKAWLKKGEQSKTVRCSIAKALGKIGREDAVDILKEWFDKEDMREIKYAILSALADIDGEAVLTLLRGHFKNPIAIDATIMGVLGKVCAKIAFDKLKQWAELDKDYDVAGVVIKEALIAVGFGGDIEILESHWSKYKNLLMARIGIAEGLGGIKTDDAIFILGKLLSKEKDESIRGVIIKALGTVNREKAIEALKRWFKKEEEPANRYRIVRTLSAIDGEKIAATLKKWREEEESKLVRDEIDKAVHAIEFNSAVAKRHSYYMGLLSSPGCWKAGYFQSELEKRREILQDVADSLCEEHPQTFIGLVIVGSMYTGNLIPRSDVDGAVIGTEPRLEGIVRDKIRSKDLSPCFIGGFCNLDDSKFVGTNRHFLFDGLFFGDRDRLINAQSEALTKTDPRSWDEALGRILWHLTYFEKLAKRFNIKDISEQQILKAYRLLHRLPLPLDEMKKAMGVPLSNGEQRTTEIQIVDFRSIADKEDIVAQVEELAEAVGFSRFVLNLKEKLRSPRYNIILAILKGRVVGFRLYSIFVNEGGGMVFSGHTGVAKGFQHQGIAKEMFRTLIDAGLKAGADRITLTYVNMADPKMRNFCEMIERTFGLKKLQEEQHLDGIGTIVDVTFELHSPLQCRPGEGLRMQKFIGTAA